MTDPSPGAYYSDRLSAGRLRRCYELAPPRVQQYLSAEIDFVLRYVESAHSVLEIGCGYGRALSRMIGPAGRVIGIDTSVSSLEMAFEFTGRPRQVHLVAMDAARLAFAARSFDLVFCVQNGIAVFGVDRNTLFAEAIRVTRRGGTVLFSSYSERFWPERLEWFRLQAAQGLLGEIDEDATGDGVIVCKDGFRAETVGGDEFSRLAASAAVRYEITEVDGSSLFCIVSVS
jgi:2-polyprenyl-6-hydroxyphenyl methylase/3-demethylubiquinone-9 3-methyltransferase